MKRDDLFAGYEQGQWDMLAKCIAAVEYLHDHEAPHDAHRDALWNALAALRALLGNDSAPDPASVDIDAYLATLDTAGLLELHRKIIIAREQGN